MRKLSMMLALVSIISLGVNAQTLPKPSPTGEVEQNIGVATVTLEYSRPGVKDRKIFGELLPYGELWRLGANACTKISTDEVLYFDNGQLAPGTYAMFAIPNSDGTWDIIFNSDTKQDGTTDYSKDKDVLRVKAKAVENSFTETLTLGFDKIRNESASLVILWEKLRVDVPFTLKTDEAAKRNIDNAVKKGEKLDKVYNSAANYYFSNKDYSTALDYVEKSIKIKESYSGLFLKARILKAQGGKDSEAISLAEKALDIAKKENAKGYADFISGTLASWKK